MLKKKKTEELVVVTNLRPRKENDNLRLSLVRVGGRKKLDCVPSHGRPSKSP